MQPLYLTYKLLLFLSALMTAVIAVTVWYHRREPGAAPFACLMLAASEWCLTYGAELGAPLLAEKVLWARLEYIGILVMPTAWLISSFQYIYRSEWVTPRRLLLLALVPATTLLAVWTNNWHHWFWSSIEPVMDGPVLLVRYSHGWAFWGHTIYSYALFWTGTVIILRQVARSWRLHRWQAMTLLVGSLTPWLGNLAYLWGAGSGSTLDVTPLAFAIAGMLFSSVIFRIRFLDIVPVAHDAVFENFADAVIVVDADDCIADVNPVARRLAGLPAANFIGRPAQVVFAGNPALSEALDAGSKHRAEVELPVEGERRTFDLRISPLLDRRGAPRGRLLGLHDMTERKRVEAQMALALVQKDAALAMLRLREAALRASEERYRAIGEELERRVNERTAELAQANRELRSSLAEKERMLMEINHRVKNNLQVISSMLSLQSKVLGSAPDTASSEHTQVMAALKESQVRVRSMALVHEKLYRARDLAHVDLGDYVRSLGSELFRAYGVDSEAIHLVVEASDLHPGLDLAVPCGLIFNELISNSLRHAFPGRETGEIRVSMKMLDEGRLSLVVRDDGIGLPPGLDLHNTETLGLQLVVALVQQLDGTVEAGGREGAEFKIVLGRPAERR